MPEAWKPDNQRGGAKKEGKSSSENENIREMVFLANQAGQGEIKVLPGKKWGFHYKANPAERAEKLQGLLSGKYKAEEVQSFLQPDALLYDINDLKEKGLEEVQSMIFEQTATMQHFDYARFASFVNEMQGQDVSPEVVEELYQGIAKGRIQKKLHDAHSRGGKVHIEKALEDEAGKTQKTIAVLPRTEKILSALKLDWMAEKFKSVSSQERDQVLALLSGEERKLLEELGSLYNEYIENGNETAYQTLVQKIKENLPQIQKPIETEGPSESMKELEEELEPLKDKVDYPGTEGDPAIPPEDSDEYHTPPPSPSSQEKVPAQPIYEIEPGLSGYYISGRKSYFDIDRKVWSKKKTLTPYTGTIGADDKNTISGMTDAGVKSLPLPNSYALDESTLKFEGERPRIFRDQNGCFYLDSKGASKFSIAFGKEDVPFIGPPVTEDTQLLHRGALSAKAESCIRNATGSAKAKAEQIRQHILANHFYPGGGDLEAAQALQYKLREESTGDNYIQNLDASEYLECYSANTKFIAMVRAAGVPARLVNGYRAEGQKKGKTAITQSGGHAWAEIWDGNSWVRFDATPNAKPEDKKKDDKGEPQKAAEEAEDGGEEGPTTPGEESTESEEGEMDEASDNDVKEAEKKLEEAEQKSEKAKEKKENLDKKIQEAKSFKDLKDLEKEVEQSDIFDEMKEELENKLEAMEEEMKDKIKEEIDKMTDDGFMDEDRRQELIDKLGQEGLDKLDALNKEFEREKSLYNAYENLREQVRPYVEEWFEYFVQRLPREQEVIIDEDSLTRQGAFNRRSVNRPRNMLFGTVKNPKIVLPQVKPLFLASVMVDVSGSMSGEKLNSARKLLVFYSELFSKIEEEFGYIRFSINTFSDGITNIKAFDQEYDSAKRYSYQDRTSSTVKVRLMTKINTEGGTNMLPAVQQAAAELREESYKYPDHASAFYFVGDGGDTSGNSDNIRKFMAIEDKERGFGEHMHSAIMLGDESQRKILADIFGDEHTSVAPNFEALLEESMKKFDDDMEEYMRGKAL